MVAITAAAILGTTAFLDYKENETTKRKHILEAYDVLNGIETNLGNKSVSMGNLLGREQSYPLQYYLTNRPIENYPSLIFLFIPQLVPNYSAPAWDIFHQFLAVMPQVLRPVGNLN
jgi:hypothetical protein